jgi:flagellin
MGFRINSGGSSMAAQRNLEVSQRQVEHSLSAISSGSRIVQPGDDAAGFSIAETLKAQLAGTQQAKRNSEMAGALIQTAEGGLNEQNNILIRMRELSVQSASDTVSNDERGYLDTEFQQLGQEFDRISKSTRYGNKQLLTGNGDEFEFQVGAFSGDENIVKFKLDQDTSGSSTGVAGLDVSSKSGARSSMKDLDDAMTSIATARATFGAVQSRFQHATDSLGVQAENIAGAESKIADVDIAEESSKLAAAQVQQQASVSVLAQANAGANRVMRLLE